MIISDCNKSLYSFRGIRYLAEIAWLSVPALLH